MKKPFHHLARGIIVKDNKLLLLHAKGYHQSFLPGGHIEFAESAKTALSRELYEECGVRFHVGNFIGVSEHQWFEDGVLNCEVTQLFEMTSQDIHTNKSPRSLERHLEFFWCDINDLDSQNLEPKPAVNIIKSYLSGQHDILWQSSLSK